MFFWKFFMNILYSTLGKNIMKYKSLKPQVSIFIWGFHINLNTDTTK